MMNKLPNLARSLPVAQLLVLSGLGAGLVWAYWPKFADLAECWSHNSTYSHGYLVPFFALALLWLRRGQLAEVRPQLTWWGVPLLAAAAALRLGGAYFFVTWAENVSLLPALAGLAVLLGGGRGLRWSWPAIAFLAFMIPLPYQVEAALPYPLQRLATLASTYTLETLGFPALAEGNVILLNDVRIGVVEACSGLSMLFIFFALSTAVASVSRRPLLDRLIIVASAIPIALAANTVRIVATGILHETVGSRLANLVFHNLAGWLMMPLALAMLGLELLILSRLLRPMEAEAPMPVLTPARPVGRARGRHGRRGRLPGAAGAGTRPGGGASAASLAGKG
jgi:exosortase